MATNKPTLFEWARFIVGALLFAGLIYVHAYVKELSVFIIAIPALLMGLDPSKFIKIGGGK